MCVYSELFCRLILMFCCVSCVAVQGFIDEPSRDWTEDQLPPLYGGFTVSDIRQRVLQLHEVS